MRLTKIHQAGLILGFITAASAAQMEFTDDGDLPDEVPIVPSLAGDTHKLQSTSIPWSLFRLHAHSTSRRVRRDVQYTLSFSPESVATSSGNALYTLPVHNNDLRNLLQSAIALGHSQDSNQFKTFFNASLNGLELIMNAIASTTERPTFNWLAYADVAQILLDNTAPASMDLVNSFVGVVKDPAGIIQAQLGIIPQVVVVPDAASPTTSPPSSSNPIPATGPKLRLAKRDYTKSIPNTALKLTVTKTAVVIGGNVLGNLAKWALDTVILEPQVYWTSLIGGSQHFQEFFGSNEFHLVAVRRQGIDAADMIEAVRAIYTIVDVYIRSGSSRGPRPSAKALQGTILNSAGIVIANWSIGPRPQGQGPGCRIATFVETAFGCIGARARQDGDL